MKVKRVTFEVEVPFECMAELAVMAALGTVFRRLGIPYQAQTISVEVSHNTRIGELTKWPPS